MKREPSTAGRSLRAVSLAITVVSIVTFTTIAYSAYQDFNGALGLLRQQSGGIGVQHVTVSGNTAQISLDFTVPNSGLYPLGMKLTCAPPKGLPVDCRQFDLTVSPGQSQTADFILTVTDVAGLRSILSAGRAVHINATASVSLEPFATIAVAFDLGPAISGAQL